MQAAGGIGAGTTLYLADSGRVELLARNVFFIHVRFPPNCPRPSCLMLIPADTYADVADRFCRCRHPHCGCHDLSRKLRPLVVSHSSLMMSLLLKLLNTVEPGTHHIVKRVVRLIVETNSLTGAILLL
jgi:hypothetical protein